MKIYILFKSQSLIGEILFSDSGTERMSQQGSLVLQIQFTIMGLEASSWMASKEDQKYGGMLGLYLVKIRASGSRVK